MKSYLGLFVLLFPLSGFSQQQKLNDDELLTLVQSQTFNYFWDGAEPISGMARERIHTDNIYPENDASTVTSGGAGFGVMAIIVGIERGFITRKEGVERLEKIVGFLETADRFHGVWPHWWYGETGKVRPFSKHDNGGDLVETSYMLTGLICAREYLKSGNEKEKALAYRMDKLWREVEFDFYTQGQNVLYWHWSPTYGWKMNFAVRGFNECQIMYVLAASSPTHSVTKEVYTEGWAEGGKIKKPHKTFNNKPLQAFHQGNQVNGGPLFWAHYSYLGLNPMGLKDKFINYGKECITMAKVNYDWCVSNPKGYKGYDKNNWGLTSSYSMIGYAGHAPSLENDLGVISPTAALSSFPYTPKESMGALRYWYENRPDLWGKYGFYDAFCDSANWLLPRYLAIDQGPIVIMIENYRTGLLWNLFMNAPEIKNGMKKIGLKSPFLKK